MLQIPILILSLLIASEASSQPLSPSPPITSHQQEVNPKQHELNLTTDQRGTETSPVFIKVIPPSSVQPQPVTETKSQNDYASPEWALVYVTIVLVVFTAGLMIYTARLWHSTRALAEEAKQTADKQATDMQASLNIAKESADAAKKSAEASLVALRPWLSCKVEIAEPVTYTTEGDASFGFRFIVKNVGHSPAMGVRFDPHLTLLSPKHESSIVFLQRMAEHNRSMPPGVAAMIIPGGVSMVGSEIGLLMFPEETYTFNYRIPLKRSEIEKSFEDIKPHTHFFPELSGLITYTYSLAKVRADTGFVLSIEKALADGRRGDVLKLDETVLVENLRLSDHSLWSGFAT